MVINVHKLNFKKERLISIPAGIFLIQLKHGAEGTLEAKLLD